MGDPVYTAALGAGHRDALTLLSVDAFTAGWLIGLTCLGVHLLLVGYLALGSGEVPRVLGVLLLLAGLGYVADGFVHVLVAVAKRYAPVLTALVAVPSIVGELGFAGWLLTRGGRDRPATA
jgi:hypothetical protein